MPAGLTKYMTYPKGTSKGGSSAKKTFTVTSGHKYRMRIYGDGQFKRASNGGQGLLGYFARHSPKSIKDWYAWTGCH
ncbi:hypothetical protein [Actinomadura parmotrematis]|uniref:DUF756 domain-containing protein n=1 Tax=Actinomadura parmotrematis TaxID=2864039 RepID=A0ABS7FL06_9ACTN|nr:hypothetical protein [Actinomadura parmotrematis]MBW8481057.1 hypothetical protein [Actinomadura parmotrematis]